MRNKAYVIFPVSGNKILEERNIQTSGNNKQKSTCLSNLEYDIILTLLVDGSEGKCSSIPPTTWIKIIQTLKNDKHIIWTSIHVRRFLQVPTTIRRTGESSDKKLNNCKFQKKG